MILQQVALFGLTVLLLAGCSIADSNASLAATEVLAKLNDSTLYNKEIRPDDGVLPVDTKIQIFIREVDVDDINMHMMVDMTFRMLWNDPRLEYNNYSGVPYVTILDPKKAWLPDPFFKGSLSTKQHVTVYPESYLRVQPTGDMTYSTRFSVKFYCPMDLTRFPHDRQTCPIKVASYGYAKDKIKFMFEGNNPVRLDEGRSETQRFHVISHETTTCDSTTATGSYSCLQVDLVMDRIFSSYLVEWYIPNVFLVVVAWFSLLVPTHLLLPRLLLTTAPLLTLTLAAHSYQSELASVPYPRASDTFMGVSLTVIFATLVYVIVSFKLSIDKASSTSSTSSSSTVAPDDEEAKISSKPDMEGPDNPPKAAESEDAGENKLKAFLKKRGDLIARVTLVGVYIFFIFVYAAAFSS